MPRPIRKASQRIYAFAFRKKDEHPPVKGGGKKNDILVAVLSPPISRTVRASLTKPVLYTIPSLHMSRYNGTRQMRRRSAVPYAADRSRRTCHASNSRTEPARAAARVTRHRCNDATKSKVQLDANHEAPQRRSKQSAALPQREALRCAGSVKVTAVAITRLPQLEPLASRCRAVSRESARLQPRPSPHVSHGARAAPSRR